MTSHINMSRYMVSVCVFAFNCENYLAQALESVISQKTDFSVEIIIGDDCSTDQTQVIAGHYQALYPDKIKLFVNNANLGGTRNWINTIKHASGKYIALLDGDDYFTRESKLQKQVDILEKHPDCVLCFHAVEEFYAPDDPRNHVYYPEKKVYSLCDFISGGWFVRTSSTMFRNHVIDREPPQWVYDFPYRLDTILHVMLARKGNAYCINENMSVWRKHANGVSNKFRRDVINNITAEIALAKKLNNLTDNVCQKDSDSLSSRLYTSLLIELLRRGAIKSPKLFVESLIYCDKCYLFRRLTKKLG